MAGIVPRLAIDKITQHSTPRGGSLGTAAQVQRVLRSEESVSDILEFNALMLIGHRIGALVVYFILKST
jgi:hypothetical protein